MSDRPSAGGHLTVMDIRTDGVRFIGLYRSWEKSVGQIQGGPKKEVPAYWTTDNKSTWNLPTR